MNKKLVVGGVLLLLVIGGGGFFVWQNGKDVRELNRNLPMGVSVTKSLFGNAYKVVNKIDRYEFEVPERWHGVNEIAYIPENTDGEYTVTTTQLEGKEGASRIVTVNRFKSGEPNIDLKSWAKTNFDTYGLEGEFTKDNVGILEVVKTQESVHLLGMYVYFFQKDFTVYAIANGSEAFIREIITHGEW